MVNLGAHWAWCHEWLEEGAGPALGQLGEALQECQISALVTHLYLPPERNGQSQVDSSPMHYLACLQPSSIWQQHQLVPLHSCSAKSAGHRTMRLSSIRG